MDRKVVLLIFVSVLLFSAIIGTGFQEGGVGAANLADSGQQALSGLEADGASATSWPMFHHDLSHTGYSTSKAPSIKNKIWSYTTGGAVYSSPAVVDGKVYVGSNDDKVYCLGATTGAFIWSYTTGQNVWSSPAVVDGKVYVGSWDSKVHCLNASTGAFIWSYRTGNWVYSSPAVVDGKVYVGSDDRNVYCLDASTGAFIWSYTTGYWVWSSPAVVDGRVYVGSNDDKVYCLGATTGAFIWSYTTGDWVWSSPAVVGGRVYVGSWDDNVYCLDASTGAFIWSYTTGSDVTSSPAVVGGRVYVGSTDMKIYCLNAVTGAFIWSCPAGHFVESSPAVADGKVYVGSHDNKVYCLNASTGTKIWSYTTGNQVYSSPAVADGKVYVGSHDKKVYAFGPLTYDVTIEAYCHTEGAPVSVSITMDGSPTGYNTPHTFTSLAYIHTFTVPSRDPNGDSFKQWSTGETSTTITVSTGGTYIAHYQARYTLNITTTTGGTTNPSPGTYTYWDETTISVTATPDTNYAFDHWELDGSWDFSNPISVTMDSNYTLLAVFIPTYTLTITTTTGGTTDPAPGTYTYISGSSVEVTAVSHECYLFDHWELDEVNVGSANPYSVLMDNNHMLYAVFVQINYTLTITATSNGTTSPAPGTYTYACGSSVQVTAIPDIYYGLDHWELDEVYVGSANPYSVLMDDNHTLHAIFVYAGVNDVAVTSVTPSKTVVGQGYSISINVTVENQGDLTEAFNVTAYVNTTVINTFLNITLTSGNSTTLTFTWNTTGMTKGAYIISAYATPVPGEISTADNTYTDGVVQIVLPGDINADGKVDLKDIGLLCIYYGQETGDPRYVPNYDVNCDGKINMKDIGICTIHYGEEDP